MNEENIELHEGIEVPVSPVLKPIRNKGYGRIADLPDEELATPAELERMVFIDQFGPILALPVSKSKTVIKPNIDEDGRLDWGAFGTVDFDRYTGGFDKHLYKADMLAERLKDKTIEFEMINDRITHSGKNLILEYVRKGVIEFEHIADSDMFALARVYLQMRRLSSQIMHLRQQSKIRRHRQLNEFLKC